MGNFVNPVSISKECRCYVHFLRNALDYLPRKADDDRLQELRWMYDRRDIQEAQHDLAARISKWQGMSRRWSIGSSPTSSRR